MAAKSKHANSSRATSVSMLFLRFLQGKRCANFDSISLSLSLSGFRSIVRFERKGRKGREEKKFKRNRKHVFQHSAPNIRVYFILDSLQSMHQNLPIEKPIIIRIVPILMDRATLSQQVRRFIHRNGARKKFNIISETRNSLLILCFILHFIH